MTLKGDWEFNEIRALIDEHEMISFDIYDTALLRNVIHPTDIFDIVSLELQNKNISIKDFKKNRIQAEKEARNFASLEDIQFDDIYEVLAKSIGTETSSKLKEIELSMEKKFTTVNPFIKRIYDYANSQGKVIIFITDMYLGKEFICNLLNLNGYEDFNDVFVSGEVGISKASSKMYSFIKERFSGNRTWLHIGDNYIADYENAKKSGINAYYYSALRDRVKLVEKYSIEYSIMKAIQINYSETTGGISYWQRYGVNVVSSLFFGFSNWLVKEVKEKNNIYFLSRDGYLPYKLYRMFSEYLEDRLPEAQYLYASRRAYQIPNVINMSQEEALELLTAYNPGMGQKLTLGEIFDNVGLNKEEYVGMISHYGITSFHSEINSTKDRDNFKNLLKAIYPDIIQIFQDEIQVINKYLIQNGIFDFEEINIVDVGWRCSTQKAIQDLTKIRTNGYYFGTAHNVYDDIRDNVRGYAFNLGLPSKNVNKIMENVMMYEFIFSAPHGSLTGFKDDQRAVTPELKDLEQNEYLYSCIDEIQTAVLHITGKYLDYYNDLKEVSTLDSLRDYFQFIDEKHYEDLLEFNKLTGVVGIGNTKDVQRYVTSISLKEFLKNKRRVIKLANKNLWKEAMIVNGSIIEVNNKFIHNFDSVLVAIVKKIYKCLRNPKKAMKYLYRLLFK